MDILELNAEERTAGKAATKKVRSEGKIPAVFYGHGIEPLALAVDAKAFRTVIHGEAGTNAILSLKIDGKRGNQNAIIKDMQKNPVKDAFLHVDFLKIAMDELIQAKVPVNIVGEAAGVKEGGVLQHSLWEIEVQALPKDLPDNLEVNVGELQIGGAIRIGDLAIPEGVEVLTDVEETIVSVVPPTELKEEELVAEEVEPEVIGEEKAPEGAAEAKSAEKEEAKEE